jgi:hypothetical protein
MEWGVEANHWNPGAIFKEDKNRTTIGNGMEGFQLARKHNAQDFQSNKVGDRDSMNKAIPCMINGKMDRLAELTAAFVARSCKSSQDAGEKRLAA